MSVRGVDGRDVYNKPYLDPYDDGIIGDGDTDVSSVLNSWLATQYGLYPNGFDVKIRKRYKIPGGFSVPGNNIAFHGTRSGALLGNQTYLSGAGFLFPTTQIKMIGVFSTSIAPVSYGYPIPAGLNTFSFSNTTLTAGQYVMVRNYPTDPGGSDAFTVNSDGTRAYANTSSSNLRIYRRIEPAEIRFANSSGIELKSGVSYDYRYVDQLQFAPFTPVRNILFDDGLLIEDIAVNGFMVVGIHLANCDLRRSAFSIARGLGCTATGFRLEAEDTGAFVGFSQSSIDFTVDGKCFDGKATADNGQIRLDQSANGLVIVSTGGHKNLMYGLLGDTNYAECPGDNSGSSAAFGDSTGRAYPDVPLRGIKIIQLDRGHSVDDISKPMLSLFISSNPFCDASGSSLTDPMVNGINVDFSSIATGGVYFKGVKNLVANLVMPNAGMRCDGTSGVLINKPGGGFYAPGLDDGSGNGNGLLEDPRSSKTLLNSLKVVSSVKYP